jgi:hypothetical protein
VCIPQRSLYDVLNPFKAKEKRREERIEEKRIEEARDKIQERRALRQ